MNILLYTDDFLTRSMTFIYNPLQLIEERHRVFVACLRRLNAELFPMPGVFVVPSRNADRWFTSRLLRKLGLAFTRRDVCFEKNLFAHAAEKQPDLVHAHFGPSGLRIYPVAKRLNLPLLITFHGFDASHLLRRRTYVRALKKMFDDPGVYGITVSAKMRDTLAGHGIDTSRVTPLHLGIDTTFFDPSKVEERREPGDFIFLQVANFVQKKGQQYAVAAFAEVMKQPPAGQVRRPRLVLAGDGPMRKEVEDLARRLGIWDRICFVGPVDRVEVRRLMASADAFVHPSVTTADGDQEGLPTVLMEAMAMGLPVLSTYHSGIPELVRDGVDGILVSERDVASLAAAMRLMCEGKTEWHSPARSRSRIIENFDLAAQTGRLMEMYMSIAGPSTSRTGG